jgi:hypothetical protein
MLNYENCVEIILTDIKCKLCTLGVYKNITYCKVLSYIHSINGTKDRRRPSAENIQIEDKHHQKSTVSVSADCILDLCKLGTCCGRVLNLCNVTL